MSFERIIILVMTSILAMAFFMGTFIG